MQQGLLSAFNPSDALPAPRYTGMLLPIERDMYGNKGNFELAVPQFLQDAYSGINKFGQAFRGELSPQELQQLASNTALNVAGGSLLGSRVIPNAVPSGGILGMGVSSSNKSLKSIDDIKRNYPNVDLDIYSSPKGLTLSKIVVPKEARSEGVGSSVMSDLVKYADENNLPIALTPDTSFGGNKTRLKSFYKNFGFVDNKGRNKDFSFRETMIRQPESGLLSQTNQVTPETGLLGKVDNVQPKSGVSEVVPPTDKADGIIAFHGSPYDFNQFSLSKINTGEGAQAFGNGLYFSSKEDIAKFYRDSVRGYRDLQGKFDYKYKGKDFYTSPAEAKTQEELGVARIIEHARQISKHPEEAKKQLIIGLSREADKAKKIDDEELQGLLGYSYSKELDAVKGIDTSDLVQSKGSMYQVKLNTINDDLIDYDKTLGEQNPKIQSIINKLKSEMIVDDAIILGFDPFEYGGNEKRAIEEAKKVLFGKDETVERFMNNWSALRGEQGSAEKLMTKYGAKGIQYLDNSSRGKRFSIKLSTNKGAYDHEPIQSGDRNQIEELAEDYREKGFKVKIEEGGDKNYVIFDDKIIDIMKKYGIVGAVGVTAMQGRGNQSSEADLSL